PLTTITRHGCCGLLTGVELADCPCFSAFCPCLITAWFLWASSTSFWLALLGIRGTSAELCAHSSKSKRSAESRKNYKALARRMTSRRKDRRVHTCHRSQKSIVGRPKKRLRHFGFICSRLLAVLDVPSPAPGGCPQGDGSPAQDGRRSYMRGLRRQQH